MRMDVVMGVGFYRDGERWWRHFDCNNTLRLLSDVAHQNGGLGLFYLAQYVIFLIVVDIFLCLFLRSRLLQSPVIIFRSPACVGVAHPALKDIRRRGSLTSLVSLVKLMDGRHRVRWVTHRKSRLDFQLLTNLLLQCPTKANSAHKWLPQ